MKDLREIIAGNIVRLRVENKLTQYRLAELLNYSDKAVSKWERAESLPDVTVLKKIADYFGVTVDYLLTEEHDKTEKPRARVHLSARAHFIITALSVLLVWLLSTAGFVALGILYPTSSFSPWLLFIYAIPVSQIVLVVFNSIWGKRALNYVFVSILVWSLLLSVYLSVLMLTGTNIWLLFILGIPAQLAIILWSGLSRR